MKRYKVLYEYTKSKIVPLSAGTTFTKEENEHWSYLLDRYKSANTNYNYLNEEEQKKIDSLLPILKRLFHKITLFEKNPTLHDIELLGIRYYSDRIGNVNDHIVFLTFEKRNEDWYDFGTIKDYKNRISSGSNADRNPSKEQELENKYMVWYQF